MKKFFLVPIIVITLFFNFGCNAVTESIKSHPATKGKGKALKITLDEGEFETFKKINLILPVSLSSVLVREKNRKTVEIKIFGEASTETTLDDYFSKLLKDFKEKGIEISDTILNLKLGMNMPYNGKKERQGNWIVIRDVCLTSILVKVPDTSGFDFTVNGAVPEQQDRGALVQELLAELRQFTKKNDDIFKLDFIDPYIERYELAVTVEEIKQILNHFSEDIFKASACQRFCGRVIDPQNAHLVTQSFKEAFWAQGGVKSLSKPPVAVEGARDLSGPISASSVADLLDNVKEDLEKKGLMERVSETFENIKTNFEVKTPSDLNDLFLKIEGGLSNDSVSVNVSGELSSEVPEDFVKGKKIKLVLTSKVTGEELASGYIHYEKGGLFHLPKLDADVQKLKGILNVENFSDAFEIQIVLAEGNTLYGREMEVKVGYTEDPFHLTFNIGAKFYPSKLTGKGINFLKQKAVDK